MDFNKAFQSYDKLEGSRCLTAPTPMNQLDAAREAVRKIGLNQKEDVQRAWFEDQGKWEMFRKRLLALQLAKN